MTASVSRIRSGSCPGYWYPAASWPGTTSLRTMRSRPITTSTRASTWCPSASSWSTCCCHRKFWARIWKFRKKCCGITIDSIRMSSIRRKNASCGISSSRWQRMPMRPWWMKPGPRRRIWKRVWPRERSSRIWQGSFPMTRAPGSRAVIWAGSVRGSWPRPLRRKPSA